ncbi:MAG: hypothetical protein ACYDD1_04995 [Caulobacteraceae bacterium]
MFDLLADASGDLWGKPLEERRERLEAMLVMILLAGPLPEHDGLALLDATNFRARHSSICEGSL